MRAYCERERENGIFKKEINIFGCAINKEISIFIAAGPIITTENDEKNSFQVLSIWYNKQIEEFLV